MEYFKANNKDVLELIFFPLIIIGFLVYLILRIAVLLYFGDRGKVVLIIFSTLTFIYIILIKNTLIKYYKDLKEQKVYIIKGEIAKKSLVLSGRTFKSQILVNQKKYTINIMSYINIKAGSEVTLHIFKHSKDVIVN